MSESRRAAQRARDVLLSQLGRSGDAEIIARVDAYQKALARVALETKQATWRTQAANH